MKKRRLVRSSTNFYSFGVIGGIAERFNIDATLLRIAYVVLTVATMNVPLVLLYIAAIFIIPKDTAPLK